MADTSGVLARLQAALSVYDPTWDVSVGSATYKILESVANEIANANNNTVLQNYSYNVNTKANSDLDAFCNLFGVYRQLGKRASGVVTFYTTGTASSTTIIPVGTQVAVPVNGNNNASAIYFSTTVPQVIPAGGVSVDVPVVATIPGTIGNVPANTITTVVSPITNITTINNNTGTAGGTDPESDAALRNRWTNTAFNNTTGTYGKYVVTALQDNNVGRANAIGAQTYWDEQTQVQAVVSGGTTNGVTFLLVAYSGMTNVISGTTFSGAQTVVASSGFLASTSGYVVASGLQSLINAYAPGYNITVSASPSTNTISGGINLSLNTASPYRLLIGSGTTIPGTGAITSGVITISGTSYYEYIKSNNPDLGVSGTLSYINSNVVCSGYLYPEGNELIGSNLNTSSQSVYINNSDYYYPTNLTPQLAITIANGSNSTGLFIGSNVEMISEYNPASSRSLAAVSGNYVDVFIDGTTAGTAIEQSAFNPSFTLYSGNALPYLNTNNYIVASGSSLSSVTSVSGDYYIPFDQQPIINLPSQLSTATSGIADTVYLYNNVTGSGYTYPIAANKYGYITFTGTIASGTTPLTTTFIPVNNANTFLYPGLALASGVATSGTQFYIQSVSSSGITLNSYVTGTYATASNVVLSGKALVYPIYDVTTNSNSVLSVNGLAFDHATPPNGWPTLPSALSWVSYQHDYNSDVTQVESLTQQSRPIGVNTLVHQATFVPLTINLQVVLTPGFSQSSAQSNVFNQLNQYLSNFGYGQQISFAGIASQVLSAGGIFNVRVTSINTNAIDGTVLLTKTSDFGMGSNQLPLLYAVNYVFRGTSNF